ncbi:MAG: DUF2226 domain-containing protein [Candidatus Micrarchaeota archaeon]
MFPSGQLVKSEELKQKPLEVVNSLKEKTFTGYVSFTVKNENGIHDFTVALIKGETVGAFHESFKTKQLTHGDEALVKTTGYENAAGFYDVVQLSEEQVQLALAVRPESEVKQREKHSDAKENKPREGNKESNNGKEETVVASSEEILNKYGLSSLAETQ